MPGRPHWTPREDIHLLEAGHAGATWAQLEGMFPGRTRQALAHRCALLEVPACPDGWFTVAEAAKRQSYDAVTFARLIERLAIPTRPLPRPATLVDVSGVRIVRMADVVARLQRHCGRLASTETTGEAAARLRVARMTLYKWARAARRYRGRGNGRAVRLAPAVWDAIARPHLGETLDQAAARLGVCRSRLRQLLRAEEGTPARRHVHHHLPAWWDALLGAATRAAA